MLIYTKFKAIVKKVMKEVDLFKMNDKMASFEYVMNFISLKFLLKNWPKYNIESIFLD